MTQRYTLIVGADEDSRVAMNLLNMLGINHNTAKFEMDELKSPVLFIPEGYVEGLYHITHYAVTAHSA
jgi:hypothetical protein